MLSTILDGWRFVGRTPVVRGPRHRHARGVRRGRASSSACPRRSCRTSAPARRASACSSGPCSSGSPPACGSARGCSRASRGGGSSGCRSSCAGAFLVALALVPSLVAAVLFTTVVGACGGVAWVTGYTLLGLEVDDEVRGRTFAFLQSAARVVLVLVLALGPAIAAPIGTHTITLAPNFQLTYNGAAWVFLLAGVLALVLGVTAYRQMDDRRGMPLLPDLLSAWRSHSVVPTPPAPHGQARRARLPDRLRGRRRRGQVDAGAAARASGCATTRGTTSCSPASPGATPLGVRLRELLLGRDERVDPRTEALLFAADRADHVATVVLPAMRRGEVVVTDRYVDSSIAYQGAGPRPRTRRDRPALPLGDRRAGARPHRADRHPAGVLAGAPRRRRRPRRRGPARVAAGRLPRAGARPVPRAGPRRAGPLPRARRHRAARAAPGADPPPGARRAPAVGPPARAGWRTGSPRRRPTGAGGRRPRRRCCAWTPSCGCASARSRWRASRPAAGFGRRPSASLRRRPNAGAASPRRPRSFPSTRVRPASSTSPVARRPAACRTLVRRCGHEPPAGEVPVTVWRRRGRPARRRRRPAFARWRVAR